MKNTKCICGTLGFSNISRASSESNLLSSPMEHNKFINNASSVSNFLAKPLSVPRPKGYQEESSVTTSIKCFKVQSLSRIFNVSMSIRCIDGY